MIESGLGAVSLGAPISLSRVLVPIREPQCASPARRMPVIPETAGSTAIKTLYSVSTERRDGGLRTEIDVAEAASPSQTVLTNESAKQRG